MRSAAIKRVALRLSIVGAVTYAGCETTRMVDDSGSEAVATVIVAPPADTLAVDETVQLNAVARSSSGTTLSKTIDWSSGDPQIATVSSSGVVSALRAGSTTITATSEGKSGQSSIVVLTTAPPPPPPPAPVANVAVTPETASVETGKTV